MICIDIARQVKSIIILLLLLLEMLRFTALDVCPLVIQFQQLTDRGISLRKYLFPIHISLSSAIVIHCRGRQLLSCRSAEVKELTKKLHRSVKNSHI